MQRCKRCGQSAETGASFAREGSAICRRCRKPSGGGRVRRRIDSNGQFWPMEHASKLDILFSVDQIGLRTMIECLLDTRTRVERIDRDTYSIYDSAGDESLLVQTNNDVLSRITLHWLSVQQQFLRHYQSEVRRDGQQGRDENRKVEGAMPFTL